MSGVPAWAVKGAKVVCVRDFADAQTVYDKGIRTKPKLNEVYVLVGAEEWTEFQATVLYIEGFPHQGFDIIGFRPVTKRTAEQDIAEHFAGFLTSRAPEGIDA